MLLRLQKMSADLVDPVVYYWEIDGERIELNDWLGRQISLRYTGRIFCTQCGRKTSKSFQSGFCYPCFRRLQECNMCMIHPERCLVMDGGCPEDDWAHAHCHGDQVVYLSNTSGVKVGITRVQNMPSRWIDQGAVQAVAFYRASNRFLVGQIEVLFKDYLADKTNWRRMLKRVDPDVPLLDRCDDLLEKTQDLCQALVDQYGHDQLEPLSDRHEVVIQYPVLRYPEKVVSQSLDKTDCVSGELLGIKGQYFILDTGVINIRKFSGYEVELT